MFNAEEGGVIVPIDWKKENLQPDKSIIVLDEGSLTLYLWHGAKQGLVARRTALRQAESLKGHGYSMGKSIIGRDIRTIKEIDSRKVERVPEETQIWEELQEILDRKFEVVEDKLITFQVGQIDKQAVKPSVKPEPKEMPKVVPKPEEKPKVQAEPISKTQPKPTREIKTVPKSIPAPAVKDAKTQEVKAGDTDLLTESRIAFVIISVLEHYEDLWVSKKSDGSIALEMIDGPICQFTVKEGAKLSFTKESFNGISTAISDAIKKKYVELNKLLK